MELKDCLCDSPDEDAEDTGQAEAGEGDEEDGQDDGRQHRRICVATRGLEMLVMRWMRFVSQATAFLTSRSGQCASWRVVTSETEVMTECRSSRCLSWLPDPPPRFSIQLRP